jgi:hypothetical protein
MSADNVVPLPQPCPRTRRELLELVQRNLGPQCVTYLPEFEARRQLGAGFDPADLEDVPGRGPCVAFLSLAGVREMARIASAVGAARGRAMAAQLSARIDEALDRLGAER